MIIDRIIYQNIVAECAENEPVFVSQMLLIGMTTIIVTIAAQCVYAFSNVAPLDQSPLTVASVPLIVGLGVKMYEWNTCIQKHYSCLGNTLEVFNSEVKESIMMVGKVGELESYTECHYVFDRIVFSKPACERVWVCLHGVSPDSEAATILTEEPQRLF